jgi:hypothetical protein
MHMTYLWSGAMVQIGYRISSTTSKSIRTSAQLTMEIEWDSMYPFLDVLVICIGLALAIRVYRKASHTGCYLNFKSNHPQHVKRGIIQGLHNKASTICQEWQVLFNDINKLRSDLKFDHYRHRFITSVLNSKGRSHPEKEKKPPGFVYLLCEGHFRKD